MCMRPLALLGHMSSSSALSDEVLYYVPLFFSLLIPNISKVLLVGGSSKIPSELLINQLGVPPHKLNRSVNADEAVARGAAVKAAQLSDRCPVS